MGQGLSALISYNVSVFALSFVQPHIFLDGEICFRRSKFVLHRYFSSSIGMLRFPGDCFFLLFRLDPQQYVLFDESQATCGVTTVGVPRVRSSHLVVRRGKDATFTEILSCNAQSGLYRKLWKELSLA